MNEVQKVSASEDGCKSFAIFWMLKILRITSFFSNLVCHYETIRRAVSGCLMAILIAWTWSKKGGIFHSEDFKSYHIILFPTKIIFVVYFYYF